MRLPRPVNRLFARRVRFDAVREERRFLALRVIFILAFAVIVARLFMLQVLAHGFYESIANDQHGLVEELFPERGEIYLTDPTATGGRFPAAVNKDYFLIYAEPRLIKDATGAAKQLAPILKVDEAILLTKLSKVDDPYEPLLRRANDDVVGAVKALGLDGIRYSAEPHRFYPDKELTAHLLGFVGMNDRGERVGRYGIEGYWDTQLAGERGFLEADRDPLGRLIGTGEKNFRPARDGDAITLTIDRNIQFVACDRLRAAVEKFDARGGSVVVMNPRTGALLALCGLPDFDPNNYAVTNDLRVFNNPATFQPYEPGSVTKPFTIAAAIDAGVISPNTTYEDTGSVTIGNFTIRNSDGKANGLQTMTQVLEKSLNTGVIFAVRRLGAEPFRKYIANFGFGQPTGIEIDSEADGNIKSLSKKGDIWSATGSFGQGLTATPLQLVTAFSAIANGGQLFRPQVVSYVTAADGTTRYVEPQVVRQVISKRAAALVSSMLVRVVENGHGKRAGVPGYWVAGKTGTAQVPRSDGQGYEKDTFIGSFVGFAPVDNPAFAMAVMIDRPQGVEWAETSAAPLFGEIAAYLLQYLQIPPERSR